MLIILVPANSGSNLLDQIEIGSGQLKITISGHRLEPDGAKIPQCIDSFDYSFLSKDGVPVSRVYLHFTDYSRTVQIAGRSPEQVDAVFSTIRDDLSAISTPIGGSIVRSLCTTLPLAFIVMSIFGLLMGHFVERRKYNRKLLIWYSFVFLFLCALIFIPKDFLAGFLALRGDASFMVRYGPQISFWGLLAGLVGLLITAVTSTVRSKPKNEMD